MTSTLQAKGHPNGAGACPARAAYRAAVLALLVAVAAAPARAQMYRYVGENGVTTYSQVPPPTGDATEMTPDPGPSQAERDAATQRLRQQLESDFDRRTERELAAEKDAAEAADAEVRAKNCSAARTNLTTLSNLGVHYLNLPDGRTLKPNEAERQGLIEEARRQIRDNCD